MRSSFHAELHARIGVPRSVVVGLVERATRRGVVEVERIVRGDENEVYRVGLVDGGVVYPRIRLSASDGDVELGEVEQEAWAMDRARAAGVPVPEVLSVERVESTTDARAAMVMVAAPGRQLAELLPTLRAGERRTAMTELGRTLARLHEVSMPGVWRPDVNGDWPDPRQRRQDFLADRTAEAGELAAAGLSADEVDATIGWLGASPDNPPDTSLHDRPDRSDNQPLTATDADGADARIDIVLCHGDLSPEHVFVDSELRVTGLIDWGLWHAGSAIGDLAYVSMGHDHADFAAIVRGHATHDPDDPRFLRRIRLSIVNQAVGHIAWAVRVGAPTQVGPLRQALAELTKQL